MIRETSGIHAVLPQFRDLLESGPHVTVDDDHGYSTHESIHRLAILRRAARPQERHGNVPSTVAYNMSQRVKILRLQLGQAITGAPDSPVHADDQILRNGEILPLGRKTSPCSASRGSRIGSDPAPGNRISPPGARSGLQSWITSHMTGRRKTGANSLEVGPVDVAVKAHGELCLMSCQMLQMPHELEFNLSQVPLPSACTEGNFDEPYRITSVANASNKIAPETRIIPMSGR